MDYVYIYDELTGPPGIFANFTDVRLSFLLETFRRRKFADFVAFSNWMVVMGYVVDNGTKSIPLLSPKNGMEVMEGFHAHWRNVSEITLLVPVIVASIAWKPFSKRIVQEARARCPDLIDADDSVDRVITVSFHRPSMTKWRILWKQYIQGFAIKFQIGRLMVPSLVPTAYLLLFMNYGLFHQDYWARLQLESRELARSVAAEVDPEGFF